MTFYDKKFKFSKFRTFWDFGTEWETYKLFIYKAKMYLFISSNSNKNNLKLNIISIWLENV